MNKVELRVKAPSRSTVPPYRGLSTGLGQVAGDGFGSRKPLICIIIVCIITCIIINRGLSTGLEQVTGVGFGSCKPLRSAFPTPLLVATPLRKIHTYIFVISDFKFDQSSSTT